MERTEFPVICPHCQKEVDVDEVGWFCIFRELDRVGKSCVWCTHCSRWFVIEEDDYELGPYIRK